MEANCDEIFAFVIDSFKRKFEIRQSGARGKFLWFSVEEKGNKVELHNAPMIDRLLQYFKMDSH